MRLEVMAARIEPRRNRSVEFCSRLQVEKKPCHRDAESLVAAVVVGESSGQHGNEVSDPHQARVATVKAVVRQQFKLLGKRCQCSHVHRQLFTAGAIEAEHGFQEVGATNTRHC